MLPTAQLPGLLDLLAEVSGGLCWSLTPSGVNHDLLPLFLLDDDLLHRPSVGRFEGRRTIGRSLLG